MKPLRTNLTAWAMVALTASITVSVAMAGPYDFELGGDKNNLRKAYLMCSFKHFQGGDCPDVFKQCQKPQNLSWTGKSTCQKAPRFGDKNAEANQALDDGAAMSENAEAPKAVEHTDAHTAKASTLDDTVTEENACDIAADAEACQRAKAADVAGPDTYDTSYATVDYAKTTATDANQKSVAGTLNGAVGSSEPVTPVDMYVYDPALDGPLLDLIPAI